MFLGVMLEMLRIFYQGELFHIYRKLCFGHLFLKICLVWGKVCGLMHLASVLSSLA